MKLLYLFKNGRRVRLAEHSDSPSEFFYGAPELQQSGVEVKFLEETDFGLGRRANVGWEALSRLTQLLFGVHAYSAYRFHRGKNEYEFGDAIVSVNNAYGVALSCLRYLSLCRAHVVFIAMGLLPPRVTLLKKWFYNLILSRSLIATISRSEQEQLSRLLPACQVHYIPFGVDKTFWCPGEPPKVTEHYILSVGNDPHRDYACLMDAWQSELPMLRIITRLDVSVGTHENVEVVSGDWRSQLLTDQELREIVRGSLFVVLPIRETMQPSGQSACLQAMACGKAVVLSDTSGIWDRTIMKDGENCLLVQPGNPQALRNAVQRLIDEPELARSIGQQARVTVENHFNTDAMAEALRQLLSEQLNNEGAAA
ncbi:MAG: glycosyltransferase family 4 protein [Pseudomonadota bacterium]